MHVCRGSVDRHSKQALSQDGASRELGQPHAPLCLTSHSAHAAPNIGISATKCQND